MNPSLTNLILRLTKYKELESKLRAGQTEGGWVTFNPA